MALGRSSPMFTFVFAMVAAAGMMVQVIAEDNGSVDEDLLYSTSIPVPVTVQSRHISRIIGGEPTSTKDFPWQVRISPVGCGGSILSMTWILSAAHCFAKGDPDKFSDEFTIFADRITIYAGLTKRSQINSDPDVQIRTITGDEIKDHLFVHPDYKKGAWYNNDIALIKVKNPLNLSEKVKPIELAHTTDILPGKEAIATGWGKTLDNGNIGSPDILQYVDGLKLISKEECKNYWGIHVTEKNICHLTRSKNICEGDSGGPLITGVGRSNGPPYVQIGISSFVGGHDCDSQWPGVFTDVSVFQEWIEDTISEHVGCSTVFTEISDFWFVLLGDLQITFPNTVETWSIELTFNKNITGLHSGEAERNITSGNAVTLTPEHWNGFQKAGDILEMELVIYFIEKPNLISVKLDGEEMCK